MEFMADERNSDIILPFKILIMRIFLFCVFYLLMMQSCTNQKGELTFESYPTYEGNDLGMTYTASKTTIKVWAPTASELKLKLYHKGHDGSAFEEINMVMDGGGTWKAELEGDYADIYYTVQAKIDGLWKTEVAEPYARAVGVNGQRAMIVDLESTDPPGWSADKAPALEAFEDIIIYELHIRDMSIHPESGIMQKGKYLGLTETGTTSHGASTGLDHLKELGITHVHILPAFDFRSIDETKLDQAKFNWGYDPQNYNVPEGSYATDPYDGSVRIKEFKAMVKALHEAGIRVIMDVVYNHTGYTEESNFNQLVPGYYYRQNENGGFSDAAACGNETASERYMMRKFIIESVTYWAREYHIDGFRFDLMGIHDLETMNAVTDALHALDPTIFIYGEGWTAGASPLPDSVRALKANVADLNGIAAFSDELRDAIKGHWYEEKDNGFVSGKTTAKESIKFGVVAATEHPQVDYEAVNYTNTPWSPQPSQTINYVSCHDNNTLYDKLKATNPDASETELIRMHQLAETIVFTSQGVPFLHAGADFLRTKYGVENSYESPDSINQIQWPRKAAFKEVFEYHKNLILFRKSHPAFRMSTKEMIQQNLSFVETDDDLLVAFIISNHANNDDWEEILVLYNGSREKKSMDLQEQGWRRVLYDHQWDLEATAFWEERKLEIPEISCVIFAKK